MRILVTGSNGYIAKSIINYLGDDHEIVPVSRQILDLSNTEQVDEFFKDDFFDVVIHCAFVGGNRLVVDDMSVYEQNLLIYNNIHKNKDRFDRLITFGSGIELSDCDKPYCLSKKDIRESVLKTDKFYNIRVYAVFDENELDRRFIKSCLNNVIQGKPMVINQNKFMDFFYMKDLITVVKYYLSTDNPPKEIDCSYQTKHTLLDVAKIINKITNKKDIKIINEGMTESYIGNSLFLDNLNLDLLGIEKGIIKTYNKIL
jgi:dTDP-4-dehydrorhamnose reductase